MFDKDKVKGHNRLVKTIKGFKVSRIGNFLRKKEDNTKRNLAIGISGATTVIGAGLLLKRKGVGFTSLKKGLKGATANTPKYPEGTTIRTKDMVVKKFNQVSDPWETPIQYKVSRDLLKPNKRGNLTRKNMLVVSNKKKVIDSVVSMSKVQKNYNSLPLPMKVTVQMEKVLSRPNKVSSVGRPPERTSLKRVLDKPLEKATRKIKDRLVREKAIRNSKK